MEMRDLYDINRIATGRTIERGLPVSAGEYYTVVHICIFNSEGKMLIQQRQPFKQGWSNLWDITVGGGVMAGDSSQSAAQRELSEELGLSLSFKNIRPHLTVNFENGFDDYYLINKDVDINALHLQYSEVKRVRWATQDEILSLIDTNAFVPYHKAFIPLLFSMRQGYGAFHT